MISNNDIEFKEKNILIKYILKEGTEVLEDNGFNLKKYIDITDYIYEKEGGIKICPNYGCGLRVIDKEGKILFTPKINLNPEVDLRISTWIGMSPGAIHYYAVLKFHSPPFRYEDQPLVITTPWDVEITRDNQIEITHELTEWEKRKYPESYKDWKVGDHYRGFYTEKEAIAAGKKAFKKYFAPGWKLKITVL